MMVASDRGDGHADGGGDRVEDVELVQKRPVTWNSHIWPSPFRAFMRRLRDHPARSSPIRLHGFAGHSGSITTPAGASLGFL